jgi:hypothetical protein
VSKGGEENKDMANSILDNNIITYTRYCSGKVYISKDKKKEE